MSPSSLAKVTIGNDELDFCDNSVKGQLFERGVPVCKTAQFKQWELELVLKNFGAVD
jgi:hypothetical protein